MMAGCRSIGAAAPSPFAAGRVNCSDRSDWRRGEAIAGIRANDGWICPSNVANCGKVANHAVARDTRHYRAATNNKQSLCTIPDQSSPAPKIYIVRLSQTATQARVA